MNAIIMAGGKGTRLRPLTCSLPKPMVPIANRPMMAHIVDLIGGFGYRDIGVTLFYLPNVVQSYFGETRPSGGTMKFFVEDTPLGTAGSVRNAIQHLKGTTLIISGDALTDINLSAALDFHRARGALVTIVLSRVENPLEYGVVITEPDGRIRRFLEKPGWGEVFSDRVNTGIYLIEPEALARVPDGRPFDFSKDLFPGLLADGTPLYGYVADGYWSDIGTLDQYRESQFDVLSGRAGIRPDGVQIDEGVWVGEGTEIHPSARVRGPVRIGRNTWVGEGVEIGEYTVIGNNVFLEKNASIKRSVIWDGCRVGRGTELRGAVIASRSVIGAGTGAYEGSVVGEHAKIGDRAIIRPLIKIWPEKTIDTGTIVSESLVWGTRQGRNLFGSSGISGGINVEMTPEFVVRISAAFASTLPRNVSVVVASDGYRASRMLKRAVISGLLSSGTNVFDLGTLTTPVTRYAVTALHAAGGVQVRLSPGDPDDCLLEFLDQNGLNIDRGRERAVENAYFCEDFARADAAGVGEVAFVPRLIESYMDGLLRGTHVNEVAAKRFRLVVNFDAGHLSMLLPTLLDRLGCEVIPTGFREFGPKPKTLDQILDALNTLSDKVRSTGADIGIVVDNNAERLILVDERGELVQDEHLLALISLVILKYSAPDALPLPVTAPQALEHMAREFNVRVERTKTSPRSQMERLAEQHIFDEPGAPRFQPMFDALISLAKILELLARESLTLSELVAMVPPIHMAKRTVPCPWKAKGQVMRSLIEEYGDGDVEMIDGLKVFHDNGWALVLPDSDQPVFKVYSEATSLEEADALAQLYMGRIESLQTEV